MEKYLIYEKGKFDINIKDLDDISKSIQIKYDEFYPIYCAECDKEYLPKNIKKHNLSKTHLKNIKKKG
jgi:hypothetical protein